VCRAVLAAQTALNGRKHKGLAGLPGPYFVWWFPERDQKRAVAYETAHQRRVRGPILPLLGHLLREAESLR